MVCGAVCILSCPSPIDDANYGEYPILCVRISYGDLVRYLTGRVDLRYLFRFRGLKDPRVTDLKNANNGTLTLVSVDLNPEWLTEEGFFSTSHTEEGSELDEIRAERKTLTVAIDGKWEFPEFSVFSGRMSDCYSFLHALKFIGKPDAEYLLDEVTPFEEFPRRRGGSSRSLYRSLNTMIPRQDRLDIQSIDYHSPGQINLVGQADILTRIETSISRIDANYLRAKERYVMLHVFLS